MLKCLQVLNGLSEVHAQLFQALSNHGVDQRSCGCHDPAIEVVAPDACVLCGLWLWGPDCKNITTAQKAVSRMLVIWSKKTDSCISRMCTCSDIKSVSYQAQREVAHLFHMRSPQFAMHQAPVITHNGAHVSLTEMRQTNLTYVALISCKTGTMKQALQS